jgi:hypothetical protein
MKINVTKQDIKEGIPDNCNECAISVALKRHFKTSDVHTGYDVDKQKPSIEVNGKKYNIKESDESVVGDFIDKFDNYVDFKYLLDDGFVVDKDLIPKPFSFEIIK